MPLCGGPMSREHSARTSGNVTLRRAVFGRKPYDGRSQPKIVDLGQSATCLGKAWAGIAVSASREITPLCGNSAALQQSKKRAHLECTSGSVNRKSGNKIDALAGA